VKPVVRVVGLGPGTLNHITRGTFSLLSEAPVARLRTRVHPSAAAFPEVASYDEWYERALSFEDLYQSIVDDLISLATEAVPGEVIYAVPGSPIVAERTVELLLERDDVTVILEPAVSVMDLACAALALDPMSVGLRVVDALDSINNFRGPGPLLILQTYSPEILASVSDRLPSTSPVKVLHHLGLDDEVIVSLQANELASFGDADHLTSLWVEEFRDAGVAMADLVDLVARLRAECPWDQEQTHASLTKHLLEEAYETVDALEALVSMQERGENDDALISHVEEELGDVLVQVVLHAELGDEEGNFNFASIADALRDKLIHRHPHVFGDLTASSADEVAARWEVLKRKEKGRGSVVDGLVWQMPALTLYAKLLRKAAMVDLAISSEESSLDEAIEALQTLSRNSALDSTVANDESDRAWGEAVSSLATAASLAGVDLEGALRARARELRDEIVKAEERS
jgi:tetrapyrrole methylase family protein / MazG family protein